MFKKFFRDRYSILSFIIILIIIIMAQRLFTLQIVNGLHYKKESQKKLIRVDTMRAPRGEILDKYGKVLANNRPGFTVEIIKSKTDDSTLNKALLKIVKILDKNNDSYKDSLPIILPYEFVFSSEQQEQTWNKQNGIPVNSSAKQAFEELRKKYNISSELSAKDARKIIALRYEMSQQNFKSMNNAILAFDVSKKTVGEIEERKMEFPGINIIIKPIRNYPNGQLASHVLGYIGTVSQVGKDGIEKVCEEHLKGIDGKRFIESDLTGRFSKSLENKQPIPGGKVYLTIDLELQKAAESALKETINKIKKGENYKQHSDVKGGTAIVVDVNSGAILALASYPNFDPNKFATGFSPKEWEDIKNDPLRPLFNRGISGRYAPGSTFKMITALAGLESGIITPETEFEGTGKYTRYEGYQPACWIWNKYHRTHGMLNVTEALKVSCNVFFYKLGDMTGISNIYKYASLFDLNEKTGIELNGEIENIVASRKTRKKLHEKNEYAYPNKMWYPGDTLQAAIGQSDTCVTPIAMANYISTLANGGTEYQLHIVKSKKSNNEKEVVIQKSPKILNEIGLQQENLDAVLKGMKAVTSEPGGTAYSIFKDFKKEKITIAGKTGTSQTGIGDKSPHAWFAGFAPYDDPRIAVAVLIEHGGSGGYAAPVAKEIFAKKFGISETLAQKETDEDNIQEEFDQTNNLQEQTENDITGQTSEENKEETETEQTEDNTADQTSEENEQKTQTEDTQNDTTEQTKDQNNDTQTDPTSTQDSELTQEEESDSTEEESSSSIDENNVSQQEETSNDTTSTSSEDNDNDTTVEQED